MMIPIITSVTREVLGRTPPELINASEALGCSLWTMLRFVALPYGRGGIVGGIMLGLGRALGETIAVFFVLKIVFDVNWYHIIESGGGSIATLIVSRFGEVSGEFETQPPPGGGLRPVRDDPGRQRHRQPDRGANREAAEVTTITFDPEALPELQKQQIQRPWRRKPASFSAAIVIASLIPFAVVAYLFVTTDIPGALLMTVVYLPLQLIASGIAALATRGTRAVLDSVIIVNAIGATIFSMVVLVSVIGSLFVRGLAAISAHFLYQNNVYISPSTPLEYGGIGHAILGTVLIVTISALIAVPIGIATAVYITEVRGRAVPYVRFFVQAMSACRQSWRACSSSPSSWPRVRSNRARSPVASPTPSSCCRPSPAPPRRS